MEKKNWSHVTQNLPYYCYVSHIELKLTIVKRMTNCAHMYKKFWGTPSIGLELWKECHSKTNPYGATKIPD